MRSPGAADAPSSSSCRGSNLFLVALDTRRAWYRYHHLFRDLLRHELIRDGRGLTGAAPPRRRLALGGGTDQRGDRPSIEAGDLAAPLTPSRSTGG